MSTFLVKVSTANRTSIYFAIAASTADAIMDASDKHAEEECAISARPHQGCAR